MSDIAIKCEGLSKRYRIGEQERYKALRDVIADGLYAPFRWARTAMDGRRMTVDGNGAGSSSGGRRSLVFGHPSSDAHIWALDDVSFEVRRGEVVGIIGRNGAGKSTLLKILSRITKPTKGYAEIHGRVGSLLEVGTGFHPELTGRENIYLNGAILGMHKAEINRKFDEIVAFAEVEKFIDTPVKRYSSGMHVRLAFAVAAYLDTEILLVDEVLSVGDSLFQEKCLRHVNEMASADRTVILVSHQMNQVRRLSARCIWLEAGRIKTDGPTANVVTDYESPRERRLFDQDGGRSETGGKLRFLEWQVLEPRSESSNFLGVIGPVTVQFVLSVNRPIKHADSNVVLYDNKNQMIWGNQIQNLTLERGVHALSYTLPFLPVDPGEYHWLVSVFDEGGLLDSWDCTPNLMVGTKPQTNLKGDLRGLLNLPCEFAIRPL